jgi:hypothetical protein
VHGSLSETPLGLVVLVDRIVLVVVVELDPTADVVKLVVALLLAVLGVTAVLLLVLALLLDGSGVVVVVGSGVVVVVVCCPPGVDVSVDVAVESSPSFSDTNSLVLLFSAPHVASELSSAVTSSVILTPSGCVS